MVRDQGHDSNTLKSFFFANVVIGCHIGDFNLHVFLNIMEKDIKCLADSINCIGLNNKKE